MISPAASAASRPQRARSKPRANPCEESRGVEIARAGGIDQPVDGRRRDGVNRALARDHRAPGAPGQRGDGTVRAGSLERALEFAHLIERHRLILVREQDVDFVRHQVAELGAVALDAETVGEREADPPACGVGDPERLAEGLLGRRRIPEIALHVEEPRPGDEVRVDIGGAELDTGAEMGVHGALGIGGDEDEAARGRSTLRRSRGGEAHAGGLDIAAKHRACRIVANLADIAGSTAEPRHAHHGVGRGAA